MRDYRIGNSITLNGFESLVTYRPIFICIPPLEVIVGDSSQMGALQIGPLQQITTSIMTCVQHRNAVITVKATAWLKGKAVET